MKMVSRITAIGLAGVAICYLGLSGYVWYHDNKRSKQADVQASAVSENNKVLGFLREKGCDYCHTPSAELPAYYYIPGAKQLMDYDIKLGYKSFNLEAVRAALLADKPVSQSDLNKIEWVMQYETMPDGLWNVLETARIHGCAVFTPSSIGSFGADTPHTKTPQDTIQRPRTMYGISKVTTELLSDYYHNKYGVDTRAVRFPGIISNVTPPGGGTTDYAVDIYYSAVKGETFV